MQQDVSPTGQVTQGGSSFRLEEATIDDLHRAIRAGETNCVEVVRHYLARVRAFNGVASALVTEDGAPVGEVTGTVRAGALLRFPRDTVKAATILPDLDQYCGPPLEFRPHGGHSFRSVGAAAVRHDHRHSECRPGQCACDTQHPRRTVGDLPRRFRSASRRPVRRRSANFSAICRMRLNGAFSRS